jgi:ferric-dicitrate binding protein FerR (iron transport regulator)
VLGLATLTGAALLAEHPVVQRGWQGVQRLLESPLEPTRTSRLVLGDGADAHIEHGTELRVVHRDATRVRVIHTTGAASYRVEERGARELVIESPGFELRAVDAAFRVAVTPEKTSLDVSAGSLEWREGAASMRLTAGTRLRRESATPRLAR